MKKNLSVAIITPTLFIKGGTQNQLMHLVEELRKKNIRCDIITFAFNPDTTYENFQALGVKAVVNISSRHIVWRGLKFIHINPESAFLYLSLFFINKFVQLIRQGHYTVLNPHDWFSVWVAAQTKKTVLPDAKIVVMLNDMPACYMSQSTAKDKWILWRDRLSHRFINRIMVLDNAMRNKALSYYKKIPVVVVRSGIDIETYRHFSADRLATRQQLGVDSDVFLLVCASVPTPHRRFEDAIEALAQIPDEMVKLMIIGDLNYQPQYGDSLIKRVANLQLEKRVIFVNRFLPTSERNAYIATSDVFLFPNENQTWGLGVVEAMALAVPVIVSNGAGVHEVLTHNENCLIYQVGQVAELRDAILTLRQNNKLSQEMRYAGQRFVFNNFSWSAYGTQVLRQFLMK